METWTTATEAAAQLNVSKKTIYRAVKRLKAKHTRLEDGIRYVELEPLRQVIRSRPPQPRQGIVRARPIGQYKSPEDTLQPILDRLEDLRSTLEHERAIARSLADQNAQLVEQNRRLLEQVDDLTALTLRLGMGRRTQELG